MGVDKQVLCIREAQQHHTAAAQLWQQYQDTRVRWVQTGRRVDAAERQVEHYTELQEQLESDPEFAQSMCEQTGSSDFIREHGQLLMRHIRTMERWMVRQGMLNEVLTSITNEAGEHVLRREASQQLQRRLAFTRTWVSWAQPRALLDRAGGTIAE
jgi:hypothetical protein